jgi:hypothetical protein
MIEMLSDRLKALTVYFKNVYVSVWWKKKLSLNCKYNHKIGISLNKFNFRLK